ncbi:hypothetical protein QN391_24215 [Pseudomonas sp. CCI1.2]|uniref:hypothetical protein n=1 Tax=Pseudomonas sp. CCI1.2 TaxID=3048614 RepID=UPI002B234785|nr:hypothetical protein [Pseudomonas sp. CCI1.2]MEB0123765.1 hypothetical protein [Pseudomonas sp. CCI1.2]
MTPDNRSLNETKSLISGVASGILEKVWDVNWCLKAIYIGFFADIALIALTGNGLFNFTFQSETALANAGKIICALLAFMTFVSLAVPVIVHILNILIQLPPTYQEKSPDCVLPRALKKLALEEKSEFLLKLYIQHTQDVKERQSKKNDARSLLVGLAILIAADHLAGWLYHLPSLMTWLQSQLSWAATALPLLAIHFAVASTYQKDSRDNWIYYPPLAAQLRDAERAAQEQVHLARQRHRELQEATHSSHSSRY